MNTPVKSLSSGKIYYSFVVLYLLFMSDFMCRVGVNSLFPVIQEELNLTDSQIGMLGSIVLVGMAVFVLPVSYLADKISRKKMIVILSIIWGGGTIISAMADSYGTLVLSRFLVGLGNSAYAAISVAMLSGWFSENRRGKAVSIYDTAMDLGFAVAASSCGILAGLMGWRATLIFVGGMSLFLSFLSLFIPEERKASVSQTGKEEEKVSVPTVLKAVLKNKPLLLISAGAGFNNFMYAATFGWVTMFMVREMGYSLAVAGSLCGAMSLIGICGYPIGGIILDKWYKKDVRSRAWLSAIMNFFYAAFTIAGFYFQFIPLLFLGYLCSTIQMSAPHIATQELVQEKFRSVSYGVYVITIQSFGAIGPILVGVLSESFGLTVALIAIQFAGFFATLFNFGAGKSYMNVYDRVKKIEAE